MTTYEEIADKVGLTGQLKERYLKYMRTRWGNPEDEKIKCQVGYATEWANRFKVGWEYEASDKKGKALLREIDKEFSLDPEKIANQIFDLFLKETEDNKQFRDALKNFIEALEKREDEWMKKHLPQDNTGGN